MLPRRVVITGFGFVSSLALDREGTWSRMLAGHHGIRRLTKLDLPLEPAQMAGEVDLPEGAGPNFDEGKWATFCERMARVALQESLGTTKGVEGLDPRRVGVFQGAGTSGMPVVEAYLQDRLAGRQPKAANAIYQSPALITDVLAMELGALGPRSTVMNACSSSLLAIGQGFERIAGGELDLVLAGAAEGLCRTTYAGFSSLKAMDPELNRPFSRNRGGLNLGEASVQFILEPLEQAKARGAVIFAEILGYGASMDAHHPTAPHPEGDGAARAMEMALTRARLNLEEVDLVSAHGTATPANDGAETLAIKRALGPVSRAVSVTSSKSQFGHTLGAAGAVGTAVAVLALRDQTVSPTLRLEDPDPLCDLDCTPLQAKERLLRGALVNAFAFGGNNVSLALRAWEGA